MAELPDDFDPEMYLELNKDVAEANADPEKHYLNFGIYEGREYLKRDLSAPVDKLETMVITNADLLRQRLGKETLLVTGSGRGGTSLVAYALLRLNYPLRADEPKIHELNAFLRANEIKDKAEESDALKQVIAQENEENVRWGFKLPSALRSLDWYVSHLRTPVVLIVCRNPLAIYRSIDRHGNGWEEGQQGLRNGFAHALTHMKATMDAAACDAPVIFLDVDLAQRKPDVFLHELASLLKLDYNEDIAVEISRPGYKAVPNADKP